MKVVDITERIEQIKKGKPTKEWVTIKQSEFDWLLDQAERYSRVLVIWADTMNEINGVVNGAFEK